MLKIWGRTNSVNVKKVLWVAEELSLAYQRIDAGMKFGVVDTPEYRRLNPNGLVPTIEDEGFVLWESHAIVRYLAAKHGAGTLWPGDPRVRADADRWTDWTHTLGITFRAVFWGLIRTPAEKRDAGAIEDARAKTAQQLRVADQWLAGRKYVAGEDFTMGDIPLGCHVQQWFNVPIERPGLPNLQAWYERLCARPAYAKVVNVPLS